MINKQFVSNFLSSLLSGLMVFFAGMYYTDSKMESEKRRVELIQSYNKINSLLDEYNFRVILVKVPNFFKIGDTRVLLEDLIYARKTSRNPDYQEYTLLNILSECNSLVDNKDVSERIIALVELEHILNQIMASGALLQEDMSTDKTQDLIRMNVKIVTSPIKKPEFKWFE